MAKPRIIIADTDINYIIPLQAKFAEEYPNETDLEIITDADYFAKLHPDRVGPALQRKAEAARYRKALCHDGEV